MSQPVPPEVFTVGELARAAGVDTSAVRALLVSGELRRVAGTRYIAYSDAVSAGRVLRAAENATDQLRGLFAGDNARPLRKRARTPVLVSSLVHLATIALVAWLGGRTIETATVDGPELENRLVFVVSPGPGGGGGGGGLRNPLPTARVARRGVERPRAVVPETASRRAVAPAQPEARKEPAADPPVPKIVERAPEPLAARVLVAPVVSAAPDRRDEEGVVERGEIVSASQGAGIGGGAGTGAGTGSGTGHGSGLGDGSGGGTGGGPYRPGSGVEPPRLLREVKAEYTDEARRRGITGDVVLEIVVRRDGTVGEISLRSGLGAGLDQRAIMAVRQWRFDPARLRGAAVDVIVEVAVEFTLR